MKVYTFFTDSHRIFLKNFLDSFPYEENLSLEIKFFDQECPSATYRQDGWKKTMRKKIEYVLYSLEETKEGEYFIHSDVDIQFFNKIKDDIEKIILFNSKDILFQNDGVALCMGFFVCKKNKNTIDFFKNVLDNLENFIDDQVAVNSLIRKSNLTYGVLPDRYFSVGPKNGSWNGQTNIYIPDIIHMHHANWTEGVNNKLKLLQLVKNLYENKK